MAAVIVPVSDVPVEVDAPVAVRERLEDFAAEVLEEAMNRPAQAVNGDPDRVRRRRSGQTESTLREPCRTGRNWGAMKRSLCP
jgi:hypothetical protein